VYDWPPLYFDPRRPSLHLTLAFVSVTYRKKLFRGW